MLWLVCVFGGGGGHAHVCVSSVTMGICFQNMTPLFVKFFLSKQLLKLHIKSKHKTKNS